jgi:hypothetical protein
LHHFYLKSFGGPGAPRQGEPIKVCFFFISISISLPAHVTCTYHPLHKRAPGRRRHGPILNSAVLQFKGRIFNINQKFISGVQYSINPQKFTHGIFNGIFRNFLYIPLILTLVPFGSRTPFEVYIQIPSVSSSILKASLFKPRTLRTSVTISGVSMSKVLFHGILPGP